MKKIVLLLIASSLVFAGGYKIPETSLNGVALSAANVAHNKNADAAYYNPANMVFMDDENDIEIDLTYIGLDAINYSGMVSLNGVSLGIHNIKAKKEEFVVPAIYYVSSKVGDARYGLSIVSPVGLSKRWGNNVATYTAEEFSLQTIEVNPTVALPIGDKIGVAIGLRIIHSSGVVKSTSPQASRDMTGDSIDLGFNVALAYQPKPELELGLTYRSRVDLSVEGDAKLSYIDIANSFGGGAGVKYISSSSAEVSIPLPAQLNLALAYTLPTKTTLEFVYERSFWSAYNELDFNYGSSVNPVTNFVFGSPIKKDWNDVSAFRLGLTQELDSVTLMGGVVYDESPAPNETLGFELPDSDSISVSFGGRYKVSKKLELGLSALYSMRENRKVTNISLNGEFTNSNVLMVSTGVSYKF